MENDDENTKAKISFGYETDTLQYTNYRYYSHNSISRKITKQDLIDRNFNIIQELKYIDMRNHKTIKKYSAQHNSLISELNMVRSLINEFFSVKNLKKKWKHKTIVLFCSILDSIWINELALDLVNKKFEVAIYNHELFKEDIEEDLTNVLESADHFIFTISEKNIKMLDTFEVTFFKEKIDTYYQTISFIVKDKKLENIKQSIYYFGEPFSTSYEESLHYLSQKLDDF